MDSTNRLRAVRQKTERDRGVRPLPLSTRAETTVHVALCHSLVSEKQMVAQVKKV